MEFVERMRKVQEEVGVVFKKAQEKIKKQVDKERKKAKVWKVEDRMMSSMKNLVFKEKPAKKLVDQYIGSYTIDEIISANTVKLQLLNLIRIYLVVNISQVV